MEKEKIVTGVVTKSGIAGAQIRLDDGRMAWVPRCQVGWSQAEKSTPLVVGSRVRALIIGQNEIGLVCSLRALVPDPFGQINLTSGAVCQATITAKHVAGSYGLEIAPGVGAFLSAEAVRGLELHVGERISACVERVNVGIRRVDLVGPVLRVDASQPETPKVADVPRVSCSLTAAVAADSGKERLLAVDVANLVLGTPAAYRGTLLPLLEEALRTAGFVPVYFVEGSLFGLLKHAGEHQAVASISDWLQRTSAHVVRVGTAAGGDLALIFYATKVGAETLTNDRFLDHPEAEGLVRHGFVIFDGLPGIAPTFVVPTARVGVALAGTKIAA